MSHVSPTTRRKRERLVADHIARGETLMDGAVRLGISYSTLRKWIRDTRPVIQSRVVRFEGEDDA